MRRDDGATLEGDALRRMWEICFKQTSRGISVVDPETDAIVSLNPALAEMHGGTVGDFIGKPLRSLFTPASAVDIPDVVGNRRQEHLRLLRIRSPPPRRQRLPGPHRGDGRPRRGGRRPLPDRLVRRPQRAPGRRAPGRARPARLRGGLQRRPARGRDRRPRRRLPARQPEADPDRRLPGRRDGGHHLPGDHPSRRPRRRPRPGRRAAGRARRQLRDGEAVLHQGRPADLGAARGRDRPRRGRFAAPLHLPGAGHLRAQAARGAHLRTRQPRPDHLALQPASLRGGAAAGDPPLSRRRRERGAPADRPRPLQVRQRLRRPRRRRPADPPGRADARGADLGPRHRGADRRRRVRRHPPGHRPRPGAGGRRRAADGDLHHRDRALLHRQRRPLPAARRRARTPRPASAPSTGRCTGPRPRGATAWSSARSPSGGRSGEGSGGSRRGFFGVPRTSTQAAARVRANLRA